MIIQIDHHHLEKLYKSIHGFIGKVCEYTRCTVNDYASEDLRCCINELEQCLERVYNPELRNLNEQCASLYKAYLSLKDVDRITAAKIYNQYLEKKSRSKQLESCSSNDF